MIFNLIRRYVLAAILIPLAAAGARHLADRIESRRGQSRATRLMRQGADAAQGVFGRRKRRRFRFGR